MMAVRQGQRGNVEYTGRAFQQDAHEAMGGDIVRALIELITNSDDAYVAAGTGEVGKITVELDRKHGQDWTVIVRDRAVGMSADEMVVGITRLGGRTSGFERGADRRGNLGRGAKDVAAFGDVTFESIKAGRYARLLLSSDGQYEVEASRRATDEDRSALGVPRGSGTSVTIRVRAGTRCPRHATLKTRLSGHYQLRDILSDPARRVELYTVNSDQRDLLAYRYPSLPVEFDDEIAITGFPSAKARLSIWRHEERHDDATDDPTRPTGILLKGGRAIYDNTLLGFEGNPHAGWFSGKVVCAYIDQLAREYDQRLADGVEPTADNPVPIISRRREGLNNQHPFVKALRQAVEGPLGELVAREAERSRREGSRLEDDQSRRAFDKLARELSHLIADELREIEAEEPAGGETGVVPPVAIVPEEAFAYLGEDRTLSVLVRNDIAAAGDVGEVGVEPMGVVELLSDEVSLSVHPRREDLLIGQLRLRPLVADESCMVTASVAGRSGVALVEVRQERLTEEEVVVPPDTLEFERSNYRVAWQREKTLRLQAPARVVGEHGRTVLVSSSDPGIVVRTPSVELSLDEDVDFFRSSVRIEARTLSATGDIRAQLVDIGASTRVTVVRREEGERFRIRLVDEDMGIFRAVSEIEIDETTGDDVQVLKVAGRHPALRKILALGPNTPESRLVIAEAVADVASRLVATRLYRLRRGAEEFSADRIFQEYYKRSTRFLPRIQAVLLGDLAEEEPRILQLG